MPVEVSVLLFCKSHIKLTLEDPWRIVEQDVAERLGVVGLEASDEILDGGIVLENISYLRKARE